MGTELASDGEIQPRSYWRWSKQDFFPEESFQSWSNYRFALSQTFSRFKNRLVSKSDEANELGEVRRQSENDMKRCLTWWDLIWFGFGSVIGAGIFVLTGQEAHNHAGPAIVLSYAASGVSAMLSVFCYAEFAVEIPVAGGSFAYLRVELGDFAAFIAAGNILLECIVGNAAVARSWTSYFTTLLNRPSDSLRILTDLKEGYNLLDPIAAAVLLVASAIAMTSTRRTSQLNWIASGCTWSSERNDHSSSGRSTWAGTLYYSHRTISHDSSMVCTCAPKDRNSYIRYATDCHFWCMYRLLFKLRCSVKFVICQYPLYLYDDVCSTTGEEVLCQRSNSSNKCLEAGYPFASYHWFLHGNFCLLGFKPQRLEGLHRDCSCLVLVNFGDFSSSTTAKNTKCLGSSTCSMAAIPLCRNKFVSHGIIGSSGFC